MVGGAHDRKKGGRQIEYGSQRAAFGYERCKEPITLLLVAYALRCLHAYNKDASNTSIIVENRTVSVSPPDIFQSAVSLDGEELVFMPGGFTLRHHAIYLRSDCIPYFCPEAFAFTAKRMNVTISQTEAWPVAVVIELDVTRTPEEEHRVA